MDLSNVFGVYHVTPSFQEFMQPQYQWLGGRTTTAKITVTEETSLNYSAVWAATRLLAGTGAGLPLPVFRGGDSEHREKDREHAVYKILNGMPNSEQSAFGFRSYLWQCVLLYGNGFAEVIRESGDPEAPLMELWPIHPDRVRISRDENGELYYRVSNTGGPDIELDQWQVLHVPSVLSFDGICGRGVIENARETIGLGMVAEKYGARWFVSGVPRMAVKTKGTWQPDARDEFRRQIDEVYGQADGPRVMLLQGDSDIVPLTISAEDSQFLETRQFNVTEIARWFNLPPHMIGDLSRSTFSNIEVQGTEFVRYSLLPWLKVWEQEIWRKLFTEAERQTYFAEHNVEGLLRGDSKTRAESNKILLDAAVITRNEWRKLENLPPVPGGDTFLTQGANVPLGPDGKPQSDFVKSSEPAKLPPPDSEEETMTSKIERVADGVKRVLKADLSRILSKESKAMQTASKRPHEFKTKMEAFFENHQTTLTKATAESLAALAECGLEIDAEQFINDWLAEVKDAAVQAMQSETPIPDTIGQLVNSTEWTQRPQKAIERLVTCLA